MNEKILVHHGIKGQKWGVRRYQNKDGSLTPAGRKRAAKLESQYTALTGRKMKSESNNSHGSSNQTKPKPKTIEERTKELQAQKQFLQTQKDVLDLNRQINALKPDTRSAGRKFIEKQGPVLAKIAWDSVGKQTLQKVIDKKLGLNDKKSSSEKLAQQAKDLENMWKVKEYKSKLGKESTSQKIKRERDDQQNRYYREHFRDMADELEKKRKQK